MPKTKAQKSEVISSLHSALDKQKSIVFIDFAGMNVKNMLNLKKQLKQNDALLTVAKKTLLTRALQGRDIKIEFAKMQGEIAAIFAFGDPIAPIKIIDAFAKTFTRPQVRGGYMDGVILSFEQIQELAKLPSFEILRARMVGAIAAPLSGFMNVLQGNIKGLMTVLTKRSET
ncbi:MAG: 50S ribosomal protein L10 [Candidatus Wildermuthbacteria bacterium]|nr:50S ribosomal protein L10 [Candidatus Wildermuthbacteria bacterium]